MAGVAADLEADVLWQLGGRRVLSPGVHHLTVLTDAVVTALPVRSQVRSGQIGSGHRSGQVGSGHRSGQVGLVSVGSGLSGSDRIGLGRVGSGRVWSGQIGLGQISSDLVSW